MINIYLEVLEADKRIRSAIRETPLEYSPGLSKITDTHVYLKCENLQYTGSFKVRGAFNKLLSLTPSEREKGIVTASSGNHGAALAYGLNKLNKLKIPGIIFIPENASSTKIENIQNYDVPLKFYGQDAVQTEMFARAYAKEHGMVYISPYNDSYIIGGQGTIALELIHQLDKIDVVFVPIGGGGLISGIAGYLKHTSPQTQIIGCLPLNSPVMEKSIKAGHIINMETFPTLSDGTSGGIELDSMTFDMCRTNVNEYVLCTEEEIKQAMVLLLKTQHLLVEGASGVALAGFLKKSQNFARKNIVVVLSGANISLETLKLVLD